MKNEIDIHSYPKMLERVLKGLDKSEVSARNKDLILGLEKRKIYI